MPTSYPGNIATFTTKVNNTDLVDASHPNSIQSEVLAIQSYVGVNPHVGTRTYTTSGYSTGTSFSSLAARLTNIEIGITGDVHSQYLKLTGGGTITASSAASKGLIVKGYASQTANLQEWQNSSGTVLAYINASGNLVDSKVAVDIDNLYVLNYVFG